MLHRLSCYFSEISLKSLLFSESVQSMCSSLLVVYNLCLIAPNMGDVQLPGDGVCMQNILTKSSKASFGFLS